MRHCALTRMLYWPSQACCQGVRSDRTNWSHHCIGYQHSLCAALLVAPVGERRPRLVRGGAWALWMAAGFLAASAVVVAIVRLGIEMDDVWIAGKPSPTVTASFPRR